MTTESKRKKKKALATLMVARVQTKQIVGEEHVREEIGNREMCAKEKDEQYRIFNVKS